MKAIQRSRLQKKILAWYRTHKRDLPWRNANDPYAVLVSEIMLQQTQVSRAIGYYTRFLNQYPTPASLARARKPALLRFWSGLGYNNRALRLRELARILVNQFQGKVPRYRKSLLSLPGIGPYSASAIMAFAFNASIPVIDTNIRRVFISKLHLPETISTSELEKLADGLIPKGKSRVWHNALMDYGSAVATARKTGIAPLTKQGRFEGSDRWVRGRLVKLLVKCKRVNISSLNNKFESNQLSMVLDKMEKEGLLKRNRDEIVF
ncbi:Fe-S cluster assembly protein HesB [Fibrobacterota bacterium]